MTARAVRVVTEVAAVDRAFDYLVGDVTAPTNVGDRVRVDFHHRSVRGWVVGDAEVSGELKTIKKWLGYGPPASMLDFLKWASERWYGSWSRFLLAASPPRVITALPRAPLALALDRGLHQSIWRAAPGVVQLAPTTDPLGLILGAYEATRDQPGSLLVLVPSESWAARLRGRLEQRGCAVASGAHEWDRMRAGWPVIVGARGAALAPVPRVAGAVVIDADDDSYRSRAAPTWDAVTILRERCRIDQAPLWCTSVFPSPALLNRGGYTKGDNFVQDWPRVIVADRRAADPHEGVLGRVALAGARRALESPESTAVVVILQRLGTGRLLACGACGELARCEECGQAEQEEGDVVTCAGAHLRRAPFCRACGSTKFRRVRVGVTTLARDVSAQLAQPVCEVTAAFDAAQPLTRVIVGTEAALQRVRRCSVVVFVDFDQYLLAPRDSARRSAVTAVGRAGRLVGSRREARGQVILQTRRRDDPVVCALEEADLEGLVTDDVATAQLLGLRPYAAWANVSGDGAEEFVAGLARDLVSVQPTPGGFVVRGESDTSLSRALGDAVRPAKKFRVAVQ